VRHAAGTDWRRRALRTSAPRLGRRLARGARILLLLLSVTGCAVEPPHPVLVPPADGSGTVALVPPPVISGFGARRGEGGSASSARHAGIDIRAPIGTPVLAAADGLVVRTGSQAFAGRLILIEHEVELTTAYYHLSTIEVVVGQAVRRGEVIGRVGMTGNATAPHLHFGVCRREGGLCGDRIESGWEDPARNWITANPCFMAGFEYPSRSRRLTYPLPCQPAPASNVPIVRAPGAPLAGPAVHRPT
jgi:hypothetical protein